MSFIRFRPRPKTYLKKTQNYCILLHLPIMRLIGIYILYYIGIIHPTSKICLDLVHPSPCLTTLHSVRMDLRLPHQGGQMGATLVLQAWDAVVSVHYTMPQIKNWLVFYILSQKASYPIVSIHSIFNGPFRKKNLHRESIGKMMNFFGGQPQQKKLRLGLFQHSGVDLFQLPALCLRKPDANDSCAHQLPIGQKPGQLAGAGATGTPFSQLMFNCWFGARWFGILGVHPSNNPFHKGIPGVQTTNPNQQLPSRSLT